MNIHRFTLISLCLVLLPASLRAQETEKQSQQETTVKEVIDRYIDALGGEMVLKSIESIQYECECESTVTNVRKGSGRLAFKDGKMAYQANGVFFKYWIESDTLFWEDASSTHTETIAEVNVLRMGSSSYAALRLRKIIDHLAVLPSDQYKESEFADCVCLEIRSTEGDSLRRFFDRETGLLSGGELRYQSVGKTNLTSWTAIEYLEHEGVMFVAKSIGCKNGVKQSTSIYSDFQIDGPIDESMFKFE